jgi:hypothetical protein
MPLSLLPNVFSHREQGALRFVPENFLMFSSG